MEQTVGSIIIVGGTRGIGLAVAERFMRKGFEAGIVARTKNQVESAVKALRSYGRVEGYTADISNYEDARRIVESHIAGSGAIDVIVNAAALQGPIGYLWENEPAAWLKTININLVGSFNICRAALPYMLKADHGVVLLFSGGGAAYARSCFSAYGSSKTGVLRLVETVHEEISEARKLRTCDRKNLSTNERGVRIYAIAPGAVRTNMTDEVLEHGEKAGSKALEEAVKIKEEGGEPPEKAAELCFFLATRRPFCLSGKLIHVNEPYREYVDRLEEKTQGTVATDYGLLRRRPF
jgi:NAD(P)-dependent dehydrogenase (short-subunit alcohol dehydrogenase family)